MLGASFGEMIGEYFSMQAISKKETLLPNEADTSKESVAAGWMRNGSQ